jgi:hypothetical protein
MAVGELTETPNVTEAASPARTCEGDIVNVTDGGGGSMTVMVVEAAVEGIRPFT